MNKKYYIVLLICSAITVFLVSLIIAGKESIMSDTVMKEKIASIGKRNKWVVAFMSLSGSNNNAIKIYSYDTDTTRVLFEAPPSVLNNPSISTSYNGKYVSFWLNEPVSQQTLCIVDIQSGGVEKLKTLQRAQGLSWSPSNDKIAFVGCINKQDVDDDNLSLFVFNLKDKSLNILYSKDIAYISNQAWSPDGTEIIFVSTAGSINSFKLADSSVHSKIKGEHPIWSPDGEHIVFLNINKKRIMLADRKGKVIKTIVDNKEIASQITPPLLTGDITIPITWLPDTDYVLFNKYVKVGAESGWPFFVEVSSGEIEQIEDFNWAFSSWSSQK